MTRKKFAVLCGDERCLFAAKDLMKNGYAVSLFGMDFLPLSDALKGASYILFPYPETKDEKTLFSPFYKKKAPTLFEIYENADENAIFFGSEKFSDKKHKTFDYSGREDFLYYNAVLTVEGAISEAIRKTPFSLFSKKILIIGNGRIGKILSDRLSSFGAKITVSARKESDLSLILSYGFENIKTSEIKNNISDFDIVFNTVPETVLTKKDLENARKDSWFFDLCKNGIELSEDKNVEKLPSLPGRFSPESAGEIISKTVLDILKENYVE